MIWTLAHRFDDDARQVADRHYNRQKIGSPQFVPPGRCLVLKARRAFWVTSWPFAQFVRHAWAGAWVCSAFRREVRRGPQASTMVREALAATRWKWPNVPSIASQRNGLICMVTFVNRDMTKPKAHPGQCFRCAGFVEDGETKGGLVALVLPVDSLPLAEPPIGAQLDMARSVTP